MSDLLDRLRFAGELEAAAEIERLTKQVEALRALYSHVPKCGACLRGPGDGTNDDCLTGYDLWSAARACGAL